MFKKKKTGKYRRKRTERTSITSAVDKETTVISLDRVRDPKRRYKHNKKKIHFFIRICTRRKNLFLTFLSRVMFSYAQNSYFSYEFYRKFSLAVGKNVYLLKKKNYVQFALDCKVIFLVFRVWFVRGFVVRPNPKVSTRVSIESLFS